MGGARNAGQAGGSSRSRSPGCSERPCDGSGAQPKGGRESDPPCGLPPWLSNPENYLFGGLRPVPLGSDEMEDLEVRFIKLWESDTQMSWTAVGVSPIPEAQDALRRRWRDIRRPGGTLATKSRRPGSAKG